LWYEKESKHRSVFDTDDEDDASLVVSSYKVPSQRVRRGSEGYVVQTLTPQDREKMLELD
jgi:hypothetical protein